MSRQKHCHEWKSCRRVCTILGKEAHAAVVVGRIWLADAADLSIHHIQQSTAPGTEYT